MDALRGELEAKLNALRPSGLSARPLYFGLGEHTQVDQIEVRWPSGTVQTLAGPIQTNTVLEIKESG